MTTPTNHEVGRRFFDAQDRLRGGPDPGLCAPGYLARLAGYPPMTLEEHQGFAAAFYAGFPDLSHNVEETVSAGDTVVVRFTLRGTQQGAFFGIPPTHRPIEIGAIAMLTLVGGLVQQVRAQFDQLGMMRQLGVVP